MKYKINRKNKTVDFTLEEEDYTGPGEIELEVPFSILLYEIMPKIIRTHRA